MPAMYGRRASTSLKLPCRAGCDAAERGKELVPAAEARALAIGEYLQRGRIGETAVGMALHQAGALGIERKRLEGGRVHGRSPVVALSSKSAAQFFKACASASPRAHRGRADERAAHLQSDANVGKVLTPLEFLAPGFEVIDPGRDRAAVAPGRGGRELAYPHVVSQGTHLDLVGLRRIHRPPGEHHAQLIVPVGEAVRLDADVFAGDALRDKTAAVDPGRQGVDDRPHPPVVARLERRRAWRRAPRRSQPWRTRSRRVTLRACAVPFSQPYDSQRSITVESGGSVRFTDSTRPCVLTGTDSTPPMFPQPAPPYSRASLFKTSRQIPRFGTPTR